MSLEGTALSVVIQSEDKELDFAIREKGGNPVDLTQATEILVLFRNADLSVTQKRLSQTQVTVSNAGGGLIRVILTRVDTAALRVGQNQSVEIRVTRQGLVAIASALNQLSVQPSLFPEVP